MWRGGNHTFTTMLSQFGVVSKVADTNLENQVLFSIPLHAAAGWPWAGHSFRRAVISRAFLSAPSTLQGVCYGEGRKGTVNCFETLHERKSITPKPSSFIFFLKNIDTPPLRQVSDGRESERNETMPGWETDVPTSHNRQMFAFAS